jgi:hypothetical protein
MLGAAQSASEVQVVLQAMPLHAYGEQDCVLAGLQVPAPSQVRPRVWVVIPEGQEGGAHDVPAG